MCVYLSVYLLRAWASAGILSEGGPKYFRGARFENNGMGTNKRY